MVFETIQDIIHTQFEVDADKITPYTRFVEDLDADSLDVVELAMSIEEEFSIPEISEEDIREIHTVGDLVDYVIRAQK